MLRTRRAVVGSAYGLVKMTVGVNVMSMASSVFLASRLLALGEFCILCWSIHLINLLLLVYYVRVLLKGRGTEKLD